MGMRRIAQILLVLLMVGVAVHRWSMPAALPPFSAADAPPAIAAAPAAAAVSALPRASFVQREVMGLRGRRAEEASYQPSAAITAAASWYRNGPQRIWYELAPGDAPPRALVVLLHGAGRNGLSMLEMWESTAQRAGLVLVAPDAPGSHWDRSRSGIEAIRRAAGDAAARYGIPADRIFLFGHSDGAAMAQWMLAQDGTPWRAVAVHGGFAAPGELAGQGAGRPFRIYLGARDQQFKPGPARDSGMAMADRGHPSDLLLIPDHGHWFYTIGPQIAWHGWMWFNTFLPADSAG